jgi:hypothetical protein
MGATPHSGGRFIPEHAWPGESTEGQEPEKFNQKALHRGNEYEDELIAKIDSEREGVGYLQEETLIEPEVQDSSSFEGNEGPDRSFYKNPEIDETKPLKSSIKAPREPGTFENKLKGRVGYRPEESHRIKPSRPKGGETIRKRE